MTMNPSTVQQLRRSRMSSSNNNSSNNHHHHHRFHVKSLGTGALSPPPTTTSTKRPTITTIRSNVKSLAIGKLSKGSPSRAAVQQFIKSSNDGSTSTSSFLSSSRRDDSTASNSVTDDSSSSFNAFPLPCLETTSHASGTFFDDVNDNFDPYLSHGRQRPIKKEPDIPRCCPPPVSQYHHSPPFEKSDTTPPTSGGGGGCTDLDAAMPIAPDDSILSPGTLRSLLIASFPSSLTLSSYLVPKSLNFTSSPSPRSSAGNNHNNIVVEEEEEEDFVLHFEATATTPIIITKAQQKQKYWKSVMTRNTQRHGYTHHQTAHAYYSLGNAYMMNDTIEGNHQRNNNKLEDACTAFETSARIYKDIYGPSHLSVAKALDSYGYAMMIQAKKRFGGSSSSKNYSNNNIQKKIQILVQAKSALDEAFAIRVKELGVWHVDTVETYNKIASIHLHLGNYKDALILYKEVYLVRKAIFGGRNHPSVAITAHTIANVLIKSSTKHYTQEAKMYYDIAIKIYQEMDLPTDHPTFAKLLKDRSSLDRIVARTSNDGVVVGYSPSWSTSSSSSSSPSSCSATVKASGAGPKAGYF